VTALILFLHIFLLAVTNFRAFQFGSSDSKPLELQGDKLGESLAAFISRHPKAQCEASTTKRKNCYQWDDISIFGFSAHPAPGCSPATRSSAGCAQGLSAQFTDGRLVMLIYAVVGLEKEPAVSILKKEYGKPQIDTPDGTIWSGGSGTLSVVVGKATEQKDAETLITFTLYA
jgi:hypothetical protein